MVDVDGSPSLAFEEIAAQLGREISNRPAFRSAVTPPYGEQVFASVERERARGDRASREA